ncbi:chloride channel protein [Acidocella sp.]|jgi:H+/Cl- antiporter ClcA|uniref:chloride channel protein n=1 Tax=Acidocella sp. TaxID=50710 RepID=UPI002F3F73FF
MERQLKTPQRIGEVAKAGATLIRTETPRPSAVTRAVVTILVGISAGLCGMALALLLHAIQHIAYGYSLDAVIGPQSFLQGVSGAKPERRVAVMMVCGLVAGCGWWSVYRFGAPLVSIKKSVDASGSRMPLGATTSHALLQIITVALGSPLGREVAPREMGALLAGWLSHKAGLSAADVKIMVACGAGAGLAAVYNVPLAGALFALEALLGSFAPAAVVPALCTSAIATVVAWVGLGDVPQYSIPKLEVTPSLVVLSVFCGPLFGLAGYWYSQLATIVRKKALRGWRMIVGCLVVFCGIGVLSIHFPQLLGNGKGPLQEGFDSNLPLDLALPLLAVKLVATTGSLWAGGEGGLLTPGMTIGALLAICLANIWNLALPTITPGAFAIIGATAFLSSSMRMPITAIALIFEFTGVGQDFFIPISIAVAGASLVPIIQASPRPWHSLAFDFRAMKETNGTKKLGANNA